MEQFLLILMMSSSIYNAQTLNVESKAGNYAVPQGQSVLMNCIPPEVLIDKPYIIGGAFIWTDEEGKEITNPRIEVQKTGELRIIHSHEDDSGVYHCKFRPPQALKHGGAVSKIFVHKLIVYKLSSHKFVTIVAFDVTKFGSETIITLLRNLLKEKVCTSYLCTPGPVTTEKCEVTEMEKQMCELSMTYEALEQQQTVRCNETCVRQNMIGRLKEAQRVLEASLLTESQNPQSRLIPDLQTFDTKHVITCKAGYHLIELNYDHCFPCLPGTYSEPDTLKCELCPVGFYQEKYGSHDCQQCLDNLTTETAGSKSRDDCRPLTDTGILKDIKEGIASLFKG